MLINPTQSRAHWKREGPAMRDHDGTPLVCADCGQPFEDRDTMAHSVWRPENHDTLLCDVCLDTWQRGALEVDEEETGFDLGCY